MRKHRRRAGEVTETRTVQCREAEGSTVTKPRNSTTMMRKINRSQPESNRCMFPLTQDEEAELSLRGGLQWSQLQRHTEKHCSDRVRYRGGRSSVDIIHYYSDRKAPRRENTNKVSYPSVREGRGGQRRAEEENGLSFLANETELMVLCFEVNKNMYRDRMLHSLHISTSHVFVTVTLCGRSSDYSGGLIWDPHQGSQGPNAYVHSVALLSRVQVPQLFWQHVMSMTGYNQPQAFSSWLASDVSLDSGWSRCSYRVDISSVTAGVSAGRCCGAANRLCRDLGFRDSHFGSTWNRVECGELQWIVQTEQRGASLEDRVVGGTLMRLHVLDGKLELLALLVPLVDGHEQQLLVHFTAHDEEVGAQAVELGTWAVGAILDVQGEAIGLHHRSTAVPHSLTQRAAGIDGPVQAHRCKQRAQEHLGISMAALGQEGHPAARLLLDLGHGLVIQEVGQPHLFVAHIVAQAQSYSSAAETVRKRRRSEKSDKPSAKLKEPWTGLQPSPARCLSVCSRNEQYLSTGRFSFRHRGEHKGSEIQQPVLYSSHSQREASQQPHSALAMSFNKAHLACRLNPHELRQSASLVTKVFVQRDYSEGTVCRFQTKFPSDLDNRIERTLLEETVKTLNSYYVEAEKIGGQSYLEGCLACATAYIVFLCMETRYEKVLKKISGYIQEQNEKIYAPRGLLLTDPTERGMRVVSFTHLLLELEISVFEDRGSGSSSPSSSMSSAGSSARLLRHISKGSISVVPKQEVGPVLVVAKDIGQGLTDNGPHHDTTPPCTHGDNETVEKSVELLMDAAIFLCLSPRECYQRHWAL
ncbi:Golgin subfamily A member 7B [Liparis tanakae]|uniref:Golgin subfamily A member 7B n=1 Tax=Liparis tanakae TaxID=230148 RepID=A0A4Z2ID24_9TELE|nr:Golgin subfamily A member 7B [Liparis tanakae]